MARILLVDNAKEQRRTLAALLQGKGHEVHEAEDGRDALENLRQRSYDLVMTEVLLSDLDGTELVSFLDTLPRKPKIIAMTGGNSQIPAEMALLLVKAQVDATIPKPCAETDVLSVAEKLLAA